MSAAAILKGVESRVLTLTGYNAGNVGIQFDGRPPAFAGQWYTAIHWSGGRGDDPNPQVLDVAHGVTVTLTARMANVPRDRVGARTLLAAQVLDRAEAIVGVIHGQWAVISAANELITGFGVTINGFAEPLVLQGYGPIQEQGPDWVGAKDGPDVLTCEVRFGEARRVTVLY